MNSQQPPKLFASIEDVPVIDLNDFLGKDHKSPEVQAVCKQVAESLHQYGILLIRDPRTNE